MILLKTLMIVIWLLDWEKANSTTLNKTQETGIAKA